MRFGNYILEHVLGERGQKNVSYSYFRLRVIGQKNFHSSKPKELSLYRCSLCQQKMNQVQGNFIFVNFAIGTILAFNIVKTMVLSDLFCHFCQKLVILTIKNQIIIVMFYFKWTIIFEAIILQEIIMIVKKQRKSHSEVAHNFRNRYLDQSELQKPNDQSINTSIKNTRQKIDGILNVKKEAAFGTNVQKLGNTTSEITKFTSKGENGESEKQRVARIDTVQNDPLMPPLHKHRKLPKGPGSPPPQILRSPPRKLTKKDMDDWNIPPCISNWKNSKGYTIPIHMRIGADGRNLQHNSINQSFADNIDALYIAERQNKLRLEERAKIQKSLEYKEYLKKEENLRNAAIIARQEGRKILEQEEEDNEEEYNEREEFRKHRKRQLEREERMKKVGVERKKQIKKEQRDISQKVALGQAQPTNQEMMFDQRLYDNAGGLQAGNSDSQEDNLYTKPLFADRNALHSGLTNQGGREGGRSEPVKFQLHKQSVFGMDSLLGKPQKKVKKDDD